MTITHVAIDTARMRAEEFPLSREWAYLNHASVGPLPQRTLRALDEVNRLFARPHVWEAGDRGQPACAVRAAIAGITGAQAQRVAFVASLAHGISICAAGIDAKPGDNVVIPQSEYPSLALPFLAQEPRGLQVRWAPKSPEGRTDLDAIARAIDGRTRAVALSHVEFADGFRNDLAALGQLCRDRDLLLIVDATQSLGAIRLDVDGWGVHAAVAHGYKWLHAGFGVGVAVFSEEGLERIRPTHAGSSSVCDNPYVPEPVLTWQPTAERFETGGLPYTLIHGMQASLTLIDEVGVDSILPHAEQLVDRLNDGLAGTGYTVASSLIPAERSQIVAISSGNRERDTRVQVQLAEAGVVTALRPRGIRVAATFYNDAGDIDRLLDALPAL
jgi:selenocysteine lyase/cysteine desulfurase